LYYQHWMLFAMAVYTLLTEKITEQDLEAAEVMLNMFLRDIGELYGNTNYVFYVHQIRHLPLYVR